MDQIVALCQKHWVPLFLASNPWEFQSSKKPKVSLQCAEPFPKGNRLETWLSTQYGSLSNVSALHLTQAFREQEDLSTLFLPEGEVHWNEKGHLLIASVLKSFLLHRLPDLRASGVAAPSINNPMLAHQTADRETLSQPIQKMR